MIGGLAGVALLAVAVLGIHFQRARNAREAVPHNVITPHNGSSYRFRLERSTITVTARKAPAINLRTVFWPRSAKRSTDQESCIVWKTPDGRAQPGMALRIVPEGAESARAIVLTQNIYAQIYYEFYVLGMDNGSRGPALGSFNMYDAVWKGSKLRPGPWHVCTRVIGRKFSLKIWFPGQSEPSWDSAGPDVRHLTLPAKWVYPGLPGSYVAHIKPGRSFGFSDLWTRSLDAG